jgi:thiamine-phosphate pyrophosphorylase
MTGDCLAALRVLVITDGRGDPGRIEAVVAAAVAGGVRGVQVREPELSARELAALCARLRPLLTGCGGLLLVNDRADVAAAGLADGVHLGGRSLPVDAVRRFLPRPALVGSAAHDLAELERAADGGADFATLSPVWPTRSKPGHPGLGPERAAAWTRAARVPVLWLGGVDAARIRSLPAPRPFGYAVLSTVFGAADPRARAAELCAAAGMEAS